MQDGVFWKSSQHSSLNTASKNMPAKPTRPDATKLVCLL